jgi:hypothetical protein
MVVHINKAYETSWKGWDEYDEAAAAADAPATEGFQAPPAASSSSCPAGATTGFPVGLQFEPSSRLYDQVLDDLLIDIKYVRSANPPSWSTSPEAPLTIDFGSRDEKALYYKSQRHEYTLHMIQIAQATHNRWLLENKAENTEDIIFYFKRSTSDNPIEYIFIVIPIIKSSAYTGSNSFLQGLYDRSRQPPFTIRDCFPEKDTTFLRYSTCLAANSGGTTTVDVLVSSVGLRVNAATMQSVWDSAKRVRESLQANTFPPLAPPTGLLSSQRFETTTATFVSDASMDTAFTRKVTSSKDVVEVAASRGFTASQVIRKDETGSYKCLPFNPDNEVKDDKIQVDLDSGLVVNDVGEPLSQVLEARAKMIAQEKGSLESKPGVWEKGLATTFAVIFFLIASALLVWLVYTIYKTITGPPAGAAAPQPAASGASR